MIGAHMDCVVTTTKGGFNVSLISERRNLFGRPLGKCILTVCLLGVAVVWCCVRSYYGDGGKEGLGDAVVPIAIRVLVMLALVVPTLVAVFRGCEVAWLVGMSGAIGTVPLLPLLP